MESGGSSNPNQQLPTETTPTGSTKQQRSINQASVQHMPITTVVRIMRRALPPHAKISYTAKTSVQESVSEFISFVTNEANQRCRHDRRKTISTDDILSAMASLGFNHYVEPLTIYMNRYRAQNPDRGPTYRRGPYAGHSASSLQMGRPPVARPLPPPETAFGGGYYGGFPLEMGGGKAEFDPFEEQSK